MSPRPQGFPHYARAGMPSRSWLPSLRAQQAIPHIARVHRTHRCSQLVTDWALQAGAPRARVPEIGALERRARPPSSAPPPRPRLPRGPGLPPQRGRAPTRGEATCPPGARRPEPREKEERHRERQSRESHFRPAGGTAATSARCPRKGAAGRRPLPLPRVPPKSPAPGVPHRTRVCYSGAEPARSSQHSCCR